MVSYELTDLIFFGYSELIYNQTKLRYALITIGLGEIGLSTRTVAADLRNRVVSDGILYVMLPPAIRNLFLKMFRQSTKVPSPKMFAKGVG